MNIRYFVKTCGKKAVYFIKEMSLDIMAILSVLVQSDFFCRDFKKIKMRRSDEIVVIGNGPSLSETLKHDMDLFAGKTIMCINDFAISEYVCKVKPDFNIFFDSIYWTKNPPAWLRHPNEQALKSLKENVSWPMTLIMPVKAKKWNWFIDLPKSNKNINILYVNWTRVDYSRNLRNFLYRRNLAMPRAINVLLNALILAINMGYTKIFLVGADHSWHENIYIGEDNVVCMKLDHFYPEKNLTPRPIFKNIEETEKYRLHELLRRFSLVFEGHHQIEEYAKFSGTKIYNASRKSYIDAYERLTLK